MKFVVNLARWCGPVLVVLGLIIWLAPAEQRLLSGEGGLAVAGVVAQMLLGFAPAIVMIGALASVVAWWLTAPLGGRATRPILAAFAIGGVAFGVWRYWDRAHAYRQATVNFDNQGARLVGTLYLPNRQGKVPGVVIVGGSGPLPRWSYYIVADHFARSGYAVLNYDKRGVGDSSGRYEGPCNVCVENVELLASDASSALTLLASRPEVRADEVGFWGVSQAGWIAPRAAVMNGRAAFMILVSGPTTTTQDEVTYERFVESRDPSHRMTPPQVEALAARSPSSWPFANFDPVPDLTSLNIPALWLQGDRDWLVPVGESVRILDGLIRNGKPYEYRIIHGAGHGFFQLQSAAFWPTMDDWLARVTAGKGRPAPPVQ